MKVSYAMSQKLELDQETEIGMHTVPSKPDLPQQQQLFRSVKDSQQGAYQVFHHPLGQKLQHTVRNGLFNLFSSITQVIIDI